MLGRVLRQPPPLADVLLDGAWARFPDRLEPLAAAASVAPRLPLARALVWSARLRQRGLATSCPLLAIGLDAGIDPVVRVRAAAALYGSFQDASAVDIARAALDDLGPTARLASEEEIGRLAPTLLAALVGGSRATARCRRRRRTATKATRSPRRSSHPSSHREHDRSAADPQGCDHGAPCSADHQARRPEYRRSVRGDQRRGRCGPPAGGRAPCGRCSDIDDLLPPGRAGTRVGVVASRAIGLPFRREPARAAPGPNDRLRPRLRSRLVPGSLHHRTLGVGSAGAVAVDGRRRSHGARGLDPYLVGSRECLLGVRRARPWRPYPGRRGAHRARPRCARPSGRPRLRMQRRLRRRIRPAEPAGCAEGVPRSVLAAGRPSPSRRRQPRRPVPRRKTPCSPALPKGDPMWRYVSDLSAAERDRLLACADCYLSLHRADGGLGSVAKAMSWATFTVVTATPGSLEFQTDRGQWSGPIRDR